MNHLAFAICAFFFTAQEDCIQNLSFISPRMVILDNDLYAISLGKPTEFRRMEIIFEYPIYFSLYLNDNDNLFVSHSTCLFTKYYPPNNDHSYFDISCVSNFSKKTCILFPDVTSRFHLMCRYIEDLNITTDYTYEDYRKQNGNYSFFSISLNMDNIKCRQIGDTSMACMFNITNLLYLKDSTSFGYISKKDWGYYNFEKLGGKKITFGIPDSWTINLGKGTFPSVPFAHCGTVGVLYKIESTGQKDLPVLGQEGKKDCTPIRTIPCENPNIFSQLIAESDAHGCLYVGYTYKGRLYMEKSNPEITQWEARKIYSVKGKQLEDFDMKFFQGKMFVALGFTDGTVYVGPLEEGVVKPVVFQEKDKSEESETRNDKINDTAPKPEKLISQPDVPEKYEYTCDLFPVITSIEYDKKPEN